MVWLKSHALRGCCGENAPVHVVAALAACGAALVHERRRRAGAGMWAVVGRAILAAAGLPAGWTRWKVGPQDAILPHGSLGSRHLAGGMQWFEVAAQNTSERKSYMGFALSVVGGLFLVGYAFSRMSARKGAKKNVQTIFDTK